MCNKEVRMVLNGRCGLRCCLRTRERGESKAEYLDF